MGSCSAHSTSQVKSSQVKSSPAHSTQGVFRVVAKAVRTAIELELVGDLDLCNRQGKMQVGWRWEV